MVFNTRKDIAALIMEFIGPFALVFLGAGAIIATQAQNLVAIAFAHGIAIAAMAAAGGHLSGGVYNPAVAIGLMAAGRLPIVRGAAYIVAELLGAVAAAGLLKALLPGPLVDAVNLGALTPAQNRQLGSLTVTIEPVAAMFLELVMTFFLMFVVFGAAVDRRGAGTIAPLVIGLIIAADIMMGGALTGAAMNPARWFGTAVVQGEFRDAWVYWVGPIGGALLAAVLYAFVMLDDTPEPEAAPARAAQPPDQQPNQPRPGARTGRSSRR